MDEEEERGRLTFPLKTSVRSSLTLTFLATPPLPVMRRPWTVLGGSRLICFRSPFPFASTSTPGSSARLAAFSASFP